MSIESVRAFFAEKASEIAVIESSMSSATSSRGVVRLLSRYATRKSGASARLDMATPQPA